MQGLEVESPETSHPQSKMTIFSQVLARPVYEQETVETPSALLPPLLKMRSCGVPPNSLRLSRATGTCWLLPLQVGRLNLGPDGDNARGTLGSGNVFRNPQMSAVFPPPCGMIGYGGATMKELNE